jgi:hypothetical protein
VTDTSAAKANRQVARLRAALRDREARVIELEERLTALESSTTMQFGRVVAAAARRPGRGVVRLPRQLYRLWKRKDAPQAQSSGERRGHLDLAGFDRPEDRMLVSSTDRLTIAGVLGPDARAAAADCARVVPLLPHDATLALDSADADLVIVDAAAGAPGGPWANLGEPGVYDREQTLAALMETARDRGLPVVLWGEALWPESLGSETQGGETFGSATPPGLARLAWSAIGTPGVSLRRFNPVGAGARDPRPLMVEPPRARVPLRVRRAADGIAAEIDARTATSDHASLPGLLRRSAVTLALTPGQVLEQLAAGALVRCPPPLADRLPDDLRDHVHDDVHDHVRDVATDYDPLPALRTIFLRYATPVRLAALCESLGLDADPLRDRQVAVVAEVHGADAARGLVAALLAQTYRPAEAVVTGPGAPVAAAELAAQGVDVHAALADVRSAWVAPWPAGDVPATYLLDLGCAAECSGADVVGPGSSAPYAFAADVEPALVRREPYLSGGTVTDWAARGARLLCFDPRGRVAV